MACKTRRFKGKLKHKKLKDHEKDDGGPEKPGGRIPTQSRPKPAGALPADSAAEGTAPSDESIFGIYTYEEKEALPAEAAASAEMTVNAAALLDKGKTQDAIRVATEASRSTRATRGPSS